MRHIAIQWRHEFPDEPIRIVSEIGDDGLEIRKLEFFADGRVGISSSLVSTNGTRLSHSSVPSLEDIVSDPQFVGGAIEANEFEVLWQSFAPRQA